MQVEIKNKIIYLLTKYKHIHIKKMDVEMDNNYIITIKGSFNSMRSRDRYCPDHQSVGSHKVVSPNMAAAQGSMYSQTMNAQIGD